jgi:HAD superfamily hydrolase (TIGR01459 family)
LRAAPAHNEESVQDMITRIPTLQGLGEIIEDYDGIICDVWGVLHNGVEATRGAAEALIEAKKANVHVILLTNAPRPAALVARQLKDFGITESAYDVVFSSGGVCRVEMEKMGAARFYHIGPKRDAPLFNGLEARPSPLEQAQYILCTGLFYDETEKAEDYRPTLLEAKKRKLRLICANPDLVVDRGGRLIPCAGAIAALYESMGGETVWIGKPKPYVYILARQRIAQHAKNRQMRAGTPGRALRILCIGDSLRTDIVGAMDAGCHSIMTLGGIHGKDIELNGQSYDHARLDALMSIYKARPTWVMPSLCW